MHITIKELVTKVWKKNIYLQEREKKDLIGKMGSSVREKPNGQ